MPDAALDAQTEEVRGRVTDVIGNVSDPDVTKSFRLKRASDDIVPTMQMMAGLIFPMSESAELRVGCRYIASGNADFGGVEASYAAYNIEAGILFRF